MIRNALRRLRSLLFPPEVAPVFMAENPRYAGYHIGRGTYGHPEVVAWDAAGNLTIGRYCSIAAGVTILLGGEHRPDWVTTYPFNVLEGRAVKYKGHPTTKGDVRIGNDVWIGRAATILSGVTIGDGAVIGAGSVVAKSVEPYSIVVGNPGRRVRYRFPPETITLLLAIGWWDWPQEEIEAAWPLLLSSNVSEFVARYAPRPVS